MARRNQDSDGEIIVALLAGAGLAIVTTAGASRAMCKDPTAGAIAGSSLAGLGGLLGGTVVTFFALALLVKD